jgi:hypothetical protein
VHSLGLYSIESAINRRSLLITESDVDAAMKRVLERSQESIKEEYSNSLRRKTLPPRRGLDDSLYHLESPEMIMRGKFADQGGLFSYIAPDKRVPANHPLLPPPIPRCSNWP